MNTVDRQRRALVAMFALSSLGATGCAMMRANFARDTALQRELDAYVIPKPLAEVWPKVTSVSGQHDELLWDGTRFTWKDVGPNLKRTTKNTDETDYGDTQSVEVTWFECEGLEAPNGCQVRYYEVRRTTDTRPNVEPSTDEVRNRRFDLEIELIRTFDPAAADRIEAAGERAAQSA